MDETAHRRFRLEDRSYSALIKKNIRAIITEINFTEKRAAEIDLIVSEIITNILKHTIRGGELLARSIFKDGYKGFEIIALDSGPGIRELKKMSADGASTTKTLGYGLGSINRFSDVFDIYSVPDWGTVVLSQVWELESFIQKKQQFEFGAVMVAKDGEELCGDGWASFESKRILKIAVFDGLGHGPEAHSAAEAAINSFKNNLNLLPDQLLLITHDNIKKTRGVVGFILEIDKAKMSCTYSGIGNITCKIISRYSSRNLISYNGTIGHVIPGSISNHVIDLNPLDMLIIHSDGIKSRRELENRPAIFNHHPTTIAACIYNEQLRGIDDATVIVVKINPLKF